MADHVRNGPHSRGRAPSTKRSASVVPPAAATSGEVGTRFGRYRLLDRIGSGGMADIFRAFAVGEQGFERVVAIKRIRQEVAQYADIGQLFADEARVSALLEHPNIVQVYDFGAVDGAYYIAMEHLKGKNLEQVLRTMHETGESLSPALAVMIAREVANGLAYAHAFCDQQGQRMGIVHRDVSPANIMLVHVGAVKLLDFGIARITSELRDAITRGRKLKGKCPYVAPEQIAGAPIDARTDIFALGAVLWEMLTGQPLFSGHSDYDTISNVMNQEIPPPSAFVPDLPEQLDRIVLTALARNPNLRYPTAQMMAADLEDVMRSMPSRHGDLTALLDRLFGRRPTPVPVFRHRDSAVTPVERPKSRETQPARVARLSTTSVTPIPDEPSVTRPISPDALAQLLEKTPTPRLRVPDPLLRGRGPLFLAMGAVAVFAVMMTWGQRRSPSSAGSASMALTTRPVPEPHAIVVRPMLSPAPAIAARPPESPSMQVKAAAPARVPATIRARTIALNVRAMREPPVRRGGARKGMTRAKPLKDPSDIHFDPFDKSDPFDLSPQR